MDAEVVDIILSDPVGFVRCSYGAYIMVMKDITCKNKDWTRVEMLSCIKPSMK